MARILGQSQRVPGAVDVQLDDGTTIPLDPSHPEVAALLQSPVGTGPRPDAPTDPLGPPESPVGTGPRVAQLGGSGASAPIAWNISDPNAWAQPVQRPETATDAPSPFAHLLTPEGQAAAAAPPGAHAAPPATPPALSVPQGPSQEEARRVAQAPIRAVTATGGAPSTQAGPLGVPVTIGGGRAPGMGGLARSVGQTYEQQQAGIRDSAEARARGAEEARGIMEQGQVEAMMRDEEALMRREERQAKIAEQTQKLDQLASAVAQRRIDPGQIFAEPDAASQVTAAVAVGLGALGQYLTGGPNAAMSIINDAIERDIAVQRDNLDRSMRAQQAGVESEERYVERQGQLLGMLREDFDDEEQREHAARVMHWENVGRQIESMALGTQSEEVRAQAEQMLAEAERAKLMHLARFQQASARGAERRILVNVRGVTVPMTDAQYVAYANQLSTREGQQEQREVQQTREYSQELRARGVPEAEASLQAIEQEIAGAGEDLPGAGLIAGNLHGLLVGQEGRRFRQRYAAYRNALVRAASGANVPPSEMERIEQQVPDIGGLTTESGIRDAIAAGRDIIESLKRGAAAGFTPEAVQTYERRGGTGVEPQLRTRRDPEY